ncbi:16S rRNA (uracil(1498)-N(3))-methyltransferase [Nonlabens xiamenensis]|uniref:16S rRNA (uracil(1498)-N(3))-methyltransferase n=1 Tax=Nonlabens xiamenensis TaxID=2341043 RepID=UPI000F609F7F|nr:16S rRNA (uracil(1498)-N(3))-methyltransferase [Nonlabens xiamenensis]
MQLFYFPHINSESEHILLDKEEARHMTRVLRKKEGDQVSITDGNGNLFTGTIQLVTSNKCGIDLAFAKAYPAPSPQLHIAIAPTKMNDRTEWFLEKATEMGVSRITPLICDHSERLKIKPERFEKILVSAMKQSQQFYLPQLDPLTKFSDFIQENHAGLRLIAHCEERNKRLLQDLLQNKADTLMLIGPEGDFSGQEIDQALKAGFLPTSLGNNRLRTETAGVYTAAVFNSFQSVNSKD